MTSHQGPEWPEVAVQRVLLCEWGWLTACRILLPSLSLLETFFEGRSLKKMYSLWRWESRHLGYAVATHGRGGPWWTVVGLCLFPGRGARGLLTRTKEGGQPPRNGFRASCKDHGQLRAAASEARCFAKFGRTARRGSLARP